MTTGGARVSGNLPLILFSALQLKEEMGNVVTKLIQNYKDGHEDRLQEAWDYVQAQVRRGWQGQGGVRVPACVGLGLGVRVPDRTCQ